LEDSVVALQRAADKEHHQLPVVEDYHIAALDQPRPAFVNGSRMAARTNR
jgi:hypothetical protein